MATSTPWGLSQELERLCRGLTFYSTASHGGYKVSPTLNRQIPLVFQQATFMQNGLKGWYEEDCDWAIVVVFLPEYWVPSRRLTPALREEAIATLERFYPSACAQYRQAGGKL